MITIECGPHAGQRCIGFGQSAKEIKQACQLALATMLEVRDYEDGWAVCRRLFLGAEDEAFLSLVDIVYALTL